MFVFLNVIRPQGLEPLQVSTKNGTRSRIPLPRAWNRRAKSAILYILALSHYAFTVMVARAANERSRRTRFRAEIDRLSRELALLQEELRIKNARMARVPPHR